MNTFDWKFPKYLKIIFIILKITLNNAGIPIVENVSCRNQTNVSYCCYLMWWSPIQIAVTRADFTQTSVTDPNFTRQPNSISIQFLLRAPKEVFTSKICCCFEQSSRNAMKLLPYVMSHLISHVTWWEMSSNHMIFLSYHLQLHYVKVQSELYNTGKLSFQWTEL